MAKMGNGSKKDFVKDFVLSEEQIYKYFACDEKFFIKPFITNKWTIKSEGDFHFLYYWLEDEKRVDTIIVKKDGQPMVFKTDKYTMVIGIDCVKIGFIFHNQNKTSSM